MTPKPHTEVRTRLAKIRKERSPAYAALFAIFEMDPVLLAQYKQEAGPLQESCTEEVVVSEESGKHAGLDEKMRWLGLEVVADDKAKG